MSEKVKARMGGTKLEESNAGVWRGAWPLSPPGSLPAEQWELFPSLKHESFSRGCWDFTLERFVTCPQRGHTLISFRLWRRFTGSRSYLSAACVAELEHVACGEQLTLGVFHPRVEPALVRSSNSGVQVNSSPPSCETVNKSSNADLPFYVTSK